MQLIKEKEQEHIKQLEDKAKELEKTLPNIFKPSAELLNLRKIQFSLAKQKNYQEAHAVQVRCNKMEKKEMKGFEDDRERKKMQLE